MKNRFTRNDVVILTLAIIGILIYILFYHQTFPSAGLYLKKSSEEIEAIAFQKIEQLGFNVSGFDRSLRFRQDRQQLKYLGKRFGSERANELMREHIPVYYWEVRWKKPENFLDRIKSEDEKGNVTIQFNHSTEENASVQFNTSLSTTGDIISFEAVFEKDVKTDSMSKSEAIQRAEMLLQIMEGDSSGNYQFYKHSGDSIHTIIYKRSDAFLGENVQIDISLAGSNLTEYRKSFNPPEEFIRDPDRTNFYEIPSILVFMIYFVLFIVILIQKLRRDEVSLKSGIAISIIVSIATVYNIITSSFQETFWEILIPILVAPVFVGFSLLAIFGVSESVTREAWPEKLLSFDALNRLNVRTSLVSRAMIRGASLGFIGVGLMTLLIIISAHFFNIYFYVKNTTITQFVLIVPALFALFSVITSSIFGESIFRLFTISFLKNKLNRNVIIAIISSLVWTFSFIGESEIVFLPVYLNIFKNFLIGLLFAWFFLRFDFSTVLIGSIVMKLTMFTYPMLFWGDTFIAWNGIITFAVLALMIGLAIPSWDRRIDPNQLKQFVPPYIHRMKERERIKKELEIARKVQLSFLPAEVPHYPGFDVATLCIPANEVGGDYYDFINLGDDKFGVVIGDVSGKGIPAAFHMTLTKGFLKAQVKESTSPRDVLIKINELFYENVSRGNFISMIYGVFDLKDHTFVFARAGHNPVIIRSDQMKKIEQLCPKGIALGLEKGVVFSRFIEQMQIDISKNDMFVLYTDGVSEAMNENKIEFGEDRLENIVKANSYLSANEMIQIIHQKIHEFVGDTAQHDDMTMIIVKIL